MRKQVILLYDAVIVAIALGCSTGQTSKKGNNANKYGSSQSAISSSTSSTIGPGGSSNVTGTTPTIQPSADPPASLKRWCEEVSGTNIIKIPGHSSQFRNLCTDSNTPTQLFTDLIAKAYTGTGRINITPLGQIAEKNGQVSWSYASALKIPISAKLHFDKVGPKQGDKKVQEQGLIADGALNVAVSSAPITSSLDKGWIRGWDMTQDWSKTILILSVVTSYSYEVNHFDLGSGSYLYTQTFGSGTSTVRNNELISALFELNGSTYLTVVGDVAVDDLGFPAQAATGLMTNVEKNLLTVYEQSKSVN